MALSSETSADRTNATEPTSRWTHIARETLTEPMILLLLGDWQEGKTEHAMQALRQLASQQA